MSKHKRQRLNKRAVATALEKANGIITTTAELLGVSRKAVYDQLKKHPDLAELKNDLENKLLDIAESQLVRNILAGDTASLIFFLKTKGKQRGYVEKQNVDITSGGGPIKVVRLVEIVKPEDE